MKQLFIFLLIISFGGLTYGQSTLPKISVTVTEPNDGSVSLAATIDSTTVAKNLTRIKYKWLVLDDNKIRENIVVWPDGSRVFFGIGNPPHKTTVILWTACLFDKDEFELLKPIITTVGGSTDPVVPIPPVQVTLPDGRFKAAQKTYDLVMQNVPENSRKACKALQASFSSIASSIASGTIYGPQDILKAVKTVNNTALNQTNVPVVDFQQWNKLYGDFIYDLYVNKKLNTSQDWQDLFNETAIGFAAVK